MRDLAGLGITQLKRYLVRVNYVIPIWCAVAMMPKCQIWEIQSSIGAHEANRILPSFGERWRLAS